MDRSTLTRIRALVAEIERLLEQEPSDAPANVVSIRDGEVELEGVIGRPQYKMFGGKGRWTAGLGVQDGVVTQWINLTAWGSVAEAARRFPKGDRVVVSGVPKNDSYVGNDGVLKSRTSFTVSHICLATDVTSVAAD